ncbi:MAG TPA: MopE-related protein, partial [Phnomibacter sp.]|nr:MopE-related protein [Phnomibacter sp.]
KLNGNNVGTNSNTYQNASLANGNVVSVVMTSNATCANPTTATSNSITMTVTPAPTWYLDADNDNYYTGSGVTQCTSPGAGYKSSGLIAGGDCNDGNAAVNPGATEICGNAIDDNCNGQTDEGCGTGDDIDGDGFTVAQGDCDDNNPHVYPGATEVCGNNTDDNCNGYVDENCMEGLPLLTLRTYPVKEGNSGITTLQVLVSLDRPAPTQMQFHYHTSDEDATAGLDYVPANGVLIIPQGASAGTVPVGIIGDVIKESNERFRLNFTNLINVIINGDPYSRIMIQDDDKTKMKMPAFVTDGNEPQLIIPNIVRRNQVWYIPNISSYKNEVMIVNAEGRAVFKTANYANNLPVGNLAFGIYYYRIILSGDDNQKRVLTGKLMVMD